MRLKFYIATAAIICSLFFAAGMKGYTFSSLTQSAKWESQAHGHGMYHK